ncbi:hypothetical protein JAAARDRAFT_569112 [Jaapia argillacea MUCL 33604]|uniref:Condensation domain-containing protein n=1 Tax=Jaapia argillacea MUCL 33604 TaxID=933084 RepID=A0A067Q1Q2_9AGAM|nr:hypothetical protein JAAARDRAFT_569112 [Jaapia argillacea MUCL 33604]
MGAWQKQPSPHGDFLYQRPLSTEELTFYWDARFNGAADIGSHVMVRSDLARGGLFQEQNVVNTWRALLLWFPLLGSRLDIREGQVYFVVSERRLREPNPEQVSFVSVSSAQEAESFAANLTNGPRPISFSLPSRLYIISRLDAQDLHHIIFYTIHLVADGMSTMNFMRAFLDTLCSPSPTRIPNLEERLALVVPSEDLYPSATMTEPRQRWRRAIGGVLTDLRRSKLKGGHTIPGKFTTSTPYTPARSRSVTVALPRDTSFVIMENCRRRGVTFGHAFLVATQVALSRLLHRRYFRGDMSKAEWEYRKRQPTHLRCPMSLRPHLNKQWQDKGGSNGISLTSNALDVSLPFIPSCDAIEASHLVDGAPPFHSLLSSARFFWRCNLIKEQTSRILRHPLHLESAARIFPLRIDACRASALSWEETQNSGRRLPGDDVLCPLANPVDTVVMAHGGSSIGNLDAVLPRTYPLPASHPLAFPYRESSGWDGSRVAHDTTPHEKVSRPQTEAMINVLSPSIIVHCRPSELYPGAFCYGEQLHFVMFWDAKVFDEVTIAEWLEEIKAATLWYLGADTRVAKL